MQKVNQIIRTMGLIIKDKKLVIMTEPEAINVDLPQDVNNNLKQKLSLIKKQNF